MLYLLKRLFSYSLMFIFGAVAVFILGDLAFSLNHPDLKPWHTLKLTQEFHADMESSHDWNRYLELEQSLFEELESYKQKVIRPAIKLDSSRFVDGGNRLERRLARDWNRSYKLDADNPEGVALFVHGLSPL